MISLNATLFVQVGLFLMLLYVLNRLMIQPIHRLILEREEYIHKRQAENVALQREIEEVANEYQKRLKRAERDARHANVSVRQAADAKAHETLVDTQSKVSSLRQRVRAEVEEELNKARKTLREQAEMVSFEVTEKVLGRRV